MKKFLAPVLCAGLALATVYNKPEQVDHKDLGCENLLLKFKDRVRPFVQGLEEYSSVTNNNSDFDKFDVECDYREYPPRSGNVATSCSMRSNEEPNLYYSFDTSLNPSSPYIIFNSNYPNDSILVGHYNSDQTSNDFVFMSVSSVDGSILICDLNGDIAPHAKKYVEQIGALIVGASGRFHQVAPL